MKKKEILHKSSPDHVNPLPSAYPIHPIPLPAYPPKPRFPSSENPPVELKTESSENLSESEVKDEKPSLSEASLPGPFPTSLYSAPRPLFVPPGHVMKSEQDVNLPIPAFQRFPIPQQIQDVSASDDCDFYIRGCP